MARCLWTKERLDELETLYHQGLTLPQLAQKLQGTISGINKVLTRYAVRTQHQKPERLRKMDTLNIDIKREYMPWDDLCQWLFNAGIILAPAPNPHQECFVLRVRPSAKAQFRHILAYPPFNNPWVNAHQILILANRIRNHFHLPPFLVDGLTVY